MNTNYSYTRKALSELEDMGIVMLCRGDDETAGDCWKLTDEGRNVANRITEAEAIMNVAFHNHYKQ